VEEGGARTRGADPEEGERHAPCRISCGLAGKPEPVVFALRPRVAGRCSGRGGNPIRYLDFERLEAIDPAAYRAQEPYPWVNPEGLLTPAGFDALRGSLPDLSLFEQRFGVARKAGQQPHDRYTLEYRDGTPVPAPWRAFIEELRSERYRRGLIRLLGTRSLALNFHWHYTPRGCSVSPHCDSSRKLGSHIFYFNTEYDWRPEWGGETLVLDDRGRFPTRSAPRFEDFDRILPADAIGNRSFLFSRRGNSWHGVREIRCPEGLMRKVFIVVLNRNSPVDRLRAKLSGKSFERY
jgi:hypothetical protein